MGTWHCIKQCLFGPAFSPSSDAGSYSPASYQARLASGRANHRWQANPEAADTNPDRSQERQIDMNVLESIVELLQPVDWASVHTLARHTSVSHDTIEAHLTELERRGVVGIGKRLIPPDRRTVAWLTAAERASGRE